MSLQPKIALVLLLTASDALQHCLVSLMLYRAPLRQHWVWAQTLAPTALQLVTLLPLCLLHSTVPWGELRGADPTASQLVFTAAVPKCVPVSPLPVCLLQSATPSGRAQESRAPRVGRPTPCLAAISLTPQRA